MFRVVLAGVVVALTTCARVPAEEKLKVFILAGDESMLRRGSIDGAPTEPDSKPPRSDRPEEIPGTLLNVIKSEPRFAVLQHPDKTWAVRKDVALYDAHPLSNNTRSPAQLLRVPSDAKDPLGFGVGPELMFGWVVGEGLEDPVLLIRFAVKHPVWFRRGSRSLGYDYLPPSMGGGLDLDGGWDVIHFNHGVWDQHYVDPKNPNRRAEPGKGTIRTPLEEYEKNLRTIVARLKQTGATLIWASTTPILEGSTPAICRRK